MKKLYIYSALITSAIFLMANSSGRGNFAGEAVTGAPDEGGKTCASAGCHNSGAFEPTLEFELLDADGNAVTKYKAGQDYTAKVVINTTGSPAAYGFQMTSSNSTQGQAGEWGTLPSGTQTVNLLGRSYVEHGMRLSDPVIEIPWTAPSEDDGEVSFYFAGNAINDNGSPSGDGGSNSSFSVTFDDPSSTGEEEKLELQLFPNPARDVIQLKNSEAENYQIFDAHGRLVQEGKIWNASIELESLSSGMFVLSLNKGETNKRFVKI